MTSRIFLKLLVGVLAVLAVALGAVDFLAARSTERTYIDSLRRELLAKCQVFAATGDTTPAGVSKLAGLVGARVTVMDSTGVVTADSEADPARMENHAQRPEMAAALAGRSGSDIRTSATLGSTFLYVAIPFQHGALRLAMPLQTIEQQVHNIRMQVLVSTTLALLLSVLVGSIFARRVSLRLGAIIGFAGRLARGDFSARLTQSGSDVLGTLAAQLNETAEKLQAMFERQEREQAELERLERVRKDFVINVSHELRTPLASIQGYTETLLDGALHDPANNVRFLKIIGQNAERLSRLTADLLTLSRIELKTQKFQFEHYYVNALLIQHVDSMRPLAEKKAIRLELEPAPESTAIFCDAEALHQIVTNLVENALKYTPESGIVTVGARAEGGGMVEIFVRDTGIGIPVDDVPRLFERFYRVDKARSRELGGTGLGLAIVKHLVKAQGGEVSVESSPNQGSTFSFTIPADDIGLPSVQPV